MTKHFRASEEPRWSAKVIAARDMTYADGPSEDDDRPPHVRAASGLSAFREYLAVIQDDANWLALIDADQQVTAVPLPPSPAGDRVFSKKRGNQADKYDLEACVTVASGEQEELVGFSSGSREERQWVLRVKEAGGGDYEAEFTPAPAFYTAMAANRAFSGAGLNIEGALSLDEDRIRLFQRGNAEARDGAEAIDATADFSWTELCEHLGAPDKQPPPALGNIRTYDLGTLAGVRLTFSDAEHLGGGRMLYSASAEDPDSGEIRGSVLGIIEADGRARWTHLSDQDGSPFNGKIEGLTVDGKDPGKVYFVIDDDDEDTPSRIFHARVSEEMISGRSG
ncbi:DUF6929 family protein [Sphingomonas glaciei]|uniref:DUF3616 domain-containing protein n=1 Tax=Sphingomonas glaciei TaxID=2938948 RepID=A0ABY5MTI8_9SPHN|nr:hypothetical protein [Sphingomonas glaciei]UUR07828.1 hypothetical protein M1K48_12980 [Sphingomonas glaciei]